MKKVKNLLITALAVVVFSSCSITTPVSAGSATIGSKVGKSSGMCYLRVLCFGVDASIQTAAKNGGITKIASVDFTVKDFLGLVQIYETTVTGE